MSSRRKSFTPYMVSVTNVEMGGLIGIDTLNNEPSAQQPSSNMHHVSRQSVAKEVYLERTGDKRVEMYSTLLKQQSWDYQCKYCTFSTKNLSKFKEHVYTTHPKVILNPLYLCAVCNFSTKKFDSLTEHNETEHPGEINFKFKRIKLDNQTILEQTIGDEPYIMQDNDNAFNFLPSCPSTMQNVEDAVFNNEMENNLDSLLLKDQITAVNVNGTIIIPEPIKMEGLSHVMPLLQLPPNLNSMPTIAVPLNTSKYNPLLDTNITLITSFNKFPYPTHAELSWLTAASKHPEEQIKVWFTTQRLKQGITWSPEEVEEARKKMFNGCMPPSHNTFTVLPTPLSESVFTSQSVAPAESCHVTGQSTLFPATTSNGTSGACATVTVTAVTNMHNLKRPLGTSLVAQDVKRPMISTDEHIEKIQMVRPPIPPPERVSMAPPPAPPENKRSMLPPLITKDMKQNLTNPFVLPKVKNPKVFPMAPTKDKIPMPPPPLLPRDRVPMIPIVLTDPKRSTITQQIRNQAPAFSVISKDEHSVLPPEVSLPFVPPLVTSQVKRPPIIQTARALPAAPTFIPTLSLESKPLELLMEQKLTGSESQPTESQNGNNRVPCGDGKNLFFDQCALAYNGLQHSNNYLAPKERPKTVPTQFPLLERLKGKTAEQLNVLEDSFQKNSFPSKNEVDHIAITTRLSREEIDSWFLERRALRDNLEKALLNSMGSKRTDIAEKTSLSQNQHALLNGVFKQSGLSVGSMPPIIAPTLSSVHMDRKSLNLLKDVFVQTRWPSPEEYSYLEAQTGLARTDIVKWFKDSRLALRSGTVQWKELYHKLSNNESNGRLISEQLSNVTLPSQERKTPTAECAKLSSQDIKEWFNNSLGQCEVGSNESQIGSSGEKCRGWVEEAVGTKMAPRELVADTD